MNGNVQLKTHINSDLHEALQRLAHAGDRSLASEVRRAIREHVERGVRAASAPSELRNFLSQVVAAREELEADTGDAAAILGDLEGDLAASVTRAEASDV